MKFMMEGEMVGPGLPALLVPKDTQDSRGLWFKETPVATFYYGVDPAEGADKSGEVVLALSESEIIGLYVCAQGRGHPPGDEITVSGSLPNNEDLPMPPVNEDFSEAFMTSWLAHQAEEATKPAPLAAYPGAWPPPKQRFPGL